MAQQRKNSSVQLPFHIQLRNILEKGAAQRLRLIKKGKSKAKDAADAFEKANVLLEKACFYAYNEEFARSFLNTGKEIMEVVLPPSFKKAVENLSIN
ncbi:MAG: hypothetical protein CVU11_14010 [Bacteroidetes bacterium HGW-Bacteroidetes-6]|jgi:hypothetical protein|nr:MAG: hypothetical protein CVU11_14010 [Bacteroidetes bacterium HGW-Bacteroidetes-6]